MVMAVDLPEVKALLVAAARSGRDLSYSEMLLALGYRFADAVTAASGALAQEVAQLAMLTQGRVQTIYNPIPPPP